MKRTTLSRLLGITAAGLLAAAVTVPAEAQRERGERPERRDRTEMTERPDRTDRTEAREREERRDRAEVTERLRDSERPEAGRLLFRLAEGPGGGVLGTPFWERPRVAERLNLTEEQTATLTESREQMLVQLDPARDVSRTANRALLAELAKDEPSRTEINTLVDNYFAARAAERKIVLGHVVNAKAALDADQLAELQEMGARLAQAAPDAAPEPAGPRAGFTGITESRRLFLERGEAPAPPRAERGEAPFRMAEDQRELMRDIRTTLAEGGSTDDVKKLLDEADVDEQAAERILRMVERWGERPAATGERRGMMEERRDAMRDRPERRRQ